MVINSPLVLCATRGTGGHGPNAARSLRSLRLVSAAGHPRDALSEVSLMLWSVISNDPTFG